MKESRIPGSDGKKAKKLSVKLWAKGVVEKTTIFEGSENTQYYIRHSGQLMYGKLDFLNCAFGLVPPELDGYESTLDAPAFDIKGINSFFLLNRITQRSFYKKNGDIANGSRKAKRIHPDTFLAMNIIAPSIEEQIKISSFLAILENRIEKQRQFIDALKSYKRGALSALFPKIGENTPQYRLSGFEGAWEKHKFRDIGTVSMCKRVFKEETTSEGGIPFYKIGTFGGKPDAFISRDLFELYKEKYPYPQKGDILLSASGTIGRIVEYGGEDAYYQDSNIVWLSHDNTVSNKFLKALYPTVKWDGIEGSTIKRLYNDNFLRTEFMIPSFLEQEALGVIFEEIDNLITHHQHKYDLLLSFKQSLLQQMFI